MNTKSILFLSLVILTLNACKSLKNSDSKDMEVVQLDEITIDIPSGMVELQERPLYRASRTRKHDLLHTKLDVRFDWEKRHLLGNAALTLKPYFYATEQLELDAKGFDIHRIGLLTSTSDTLDLEYKYENAEFLLINLGKEYTRKDTFHIFIDYTAKPDERKTSGSSAISSDKGLYFINPDSTEHKKPTQIWTQGETEANSCWFPTIDSPNERTSQEIYITVDNKYKTLSNGTLVYSIENGDGTRTDYWKQELDHTPYLFMMAIGDFAVVKDKWRDLDVHYYVEPDYESYARGIFMHTPEMMEFFSNILGVDYPWDKYHQVIVRDYVSGAMENTSASIFGEFVQKNDRELLDETNEEIVAHELFHQWFGDIVTCESWSNLPLNESFATYGEYLWFEYKHGRARADYEGHISLDQYFSEALQKQVDMIRFNYLDKEDMFDRHSYNKGGQILHMLRKYSGDEAFFASLKKYLEDNKYSAVEIHDLRLAFEAVTGEDLNWFFNQWFLASGHPQIEISQEFKSPSEVVVKIRQLQNTENTPIYKLPVDIDFYFADGNQRERIVIDKTIQDFEFKFDKDILLVNFDAEKMLLAEKRDIKPINQFIHQYYHAPLFLDKLEAMKAISEEDELTQEMVEVLLDAIQSPMENIREEAIDMAEVIQPHASQKLYESLKKATQDKFPFVRAEALNQLTELYDEQELGEYYEKAISDSSYQVLAAGFEGLMKTNPKRAAEMTDDLEQINNKEIISALLEFYVENPEVKNHEFFIKSIQEGGSYYKYNYIKQYIYYLSFLGDEREMLRSIPIFEDAITNASAWWIKLVGYEGLFSMDLVLGYKLMGQNEALNQLKEQGASTGETAELEHKIKSLSEVKSVFHDKFVKHLKTENNQRVLEIIQREFLGQQD
jgi:aminopeptidase N